jgi:hypothetical protein
MELIINPDISIYMDTVGILRKSRSNIKAHETRDNLALQATNAVSPWLTFLAGRDGPLGDFSAIKTKLSPPPCLALSSVLVILCLQSSVLTPASATLLDAADDDKGQ